MYAWLDNPAVEAALPGLAIAFAMAVILPFVPTTHRVVRPLGAAAAVGTMMWYLHWRITGTLPPAGLTTDYVVGILFLLVEASALVGSAITFTTISRTRSRTADIDAALAEGVDGADKLVDVLICTYSEDADILERTIRCALSMDHRNKRIWVADDGRRAWLKQMCEDLECGYIVRPDNSHAKAGNINHALGVLGTLDREPDYVMVLDADFAARRDFLTRTLPVFADPTVAIVQTPQHFHNEDPMQANLRAARYWPDEQRFFFDIILPSKDAWGSAFCCGTSSVIDYQLLKAAGGLATFSVTEDYLLTVKMKEFGYRTAYVNERLSLGLAPEGLREYITQRGRWCLGLIQICMSDRGPLNFTNNLRIADRIGLIESFAFWAGVHSFRLLCVIVPALFLLFDIRAVHADHVEAITHFLPAYVVQLGFVVWVSRGRILPVLTDVSQLLCAPTILRSVWAGMVDPKNHSFKVTAKGGDRSRIVVQWRQLSLFLALLLMTAAGIYRTFVFEGGIASEPSAAIALTWGWYNIVVLTICCLVCIELPRPSRQWLTGAHAWFQQDNGVEPMAVELVNTNRAGATFRLRDESMVNTLKDGSTARIQVDGSVYEGRVRVDPARGLVGLKFDTHHLTPTAIPLWQVVFERQFAKAGPDIRPARVFGAILARGLG